MERQLSRQQSVYCRELAARKTLANLAWRAKSYQVPGQGQPRSKKRSFLIHSLPPVAPCNLLLLFALQ